MRIIICSNISGAGKDTVAEYLASMYGAKQFSFATGIYDICIRYFNMREKDRGLLQQVGEKLRYVDPNVWVNYTFRQANAEKSAVISDLRRASEYEFAVQHGYFPLRIVTDRDIAIRRLIERDGKCDTSLLDNESETGTRNIPMHEITNNSSFKELYDKLDALVASGKLHTLGQSAC